ncbi:hypothetical protein MUU45_001138 [Rodentibacter pneumotropicus]|uniref:Uncharacterized protein n=1 Tax=Rodentibacter pneumotropicus TaxID=758 RepID=A0AAW5LCY1_9PAST|nr:hypothetical protein [Rodentibacter pneumotropicus]MCQ9121589.1 hypothetical protein [Rodentibacter pneumotropicus]
MYFRKGYNIFPYQSGPGSDDCQNPTPNIGGIDLVSYPEQIDKIPEIALLPELKQTLVELNTLDSPFVTLGCAHWINKIDNSHFSYLEFTFKNKEIANNLEFLQQMETQLHQFLIEKLTINFTQEQRDYYASYLEEQSQIYYNKFYYLDETTPRNLLGLVFCFPDRETVDLHYKALRLFLTQHLTLPS